MENKLSFLRTFFSCEIDFIISYNLCIEFWKKSQAKLLGLYNIWNYFIQCRAVTIIFDN